MLLVSTDLLYFTDLGDRLPRGGGEFERIIRAKEAAKLVTNLPPAEVKRLA